MTRGPRPRACTLGQGSLLALLAFVTTLAAPPAGAAGVGALAAPGSRVAPAAAPTHRLAGRIVRVIDGDTVRMVLADGSQRTIRLASIDAPETGGGQRPGQPYGQAARRELTRLVEGKTLTAVCHDVDPHRRDVCDLPLPEGVTANQVMAGAGLAWANRERRGAFLRDPAVAVAEDAARRQRRGLWADPDPVAPWRWRHVCWREGRCNGS